MTIPRSAARERYDELSDELSRRFRSALAELVAQAEGLSGRYLEPEERFGLSSLPWLQWTSNELGGYWVSYGLEFDESRSESCWRTFLRVSYLTDAEGEPQPDGADGGRSYEALGLGYLAPFDASARDAEMMAELVVAGIRLDERRRQDRIERARREALQQQPPTSPPWRLTQ